MDREIPYTRIYATVDLDAVVYNIKMMKANLREGTGMMAVVKTDGYGHGAAPVAWAACPYVEMYAVASAQEALNLKKHGIPKPILILGPVHHSHYETLIREEIRIPVFTWRQAEQVSEKAQAVGKTAYIHLAVDTGMNRIGMRPDEPSAELAVKIDGLPGICAEGLFTHFARADEEDKTSALKQAKRYGDFVRMLEERGLRIPVKHISNSAGIIDLPELVSMGGAENGSPAGTGCGVLAEPVSGRNRAVLPKTVSDSGLSLSHCLVRAGISMYGLYPSNEVKKEMVPLKPVMELKSFITYIKQIEPGDQVSYGGTFTAQAPMTVATVSAGYGDGYPRNQSGKGHVLIRGQKVPILGRVCMDQMVVDVSGISEVQEGDTVTLIGVDGNQSISVEELADVGGGFHYEIVCDIGKRVPRVYLKDGKIVGTKDYFQDIYQDFTS